VKIIIQLSKEEEAKALPILLRHAPGMILPERTYVLGKDAVGLLQNAGIRFAQLSRDLYLCLSVFVCGFTLFFRAEAYGH
jgi:hypothetical protein